MSSTTSNLGGHSLLVTQVVSRAGVWGMPVSLLYVFERQTIAAIVQALDVDGGRDGD